MGAAEVSVLLPVHNAERYVAEAVESILAQTLRNFELVVVDDSTDRSTAILSEYARRDPRIRLVTRPHTGLIEALNDGLALCGGEFVARMDADDVAFPERFSRQVSFLRANPECLAVGCAVVQIDEDGDVLCEERLPLDHDAIDRELLTGRGGIAHPAAMIRRAALVEVAGYRAEAIGVEDKDLWLRLAERGKLANLPEVLLKYRVHTTNASFRHYERWLDVLRTVLEETYRRRNLPCPGDVVASMPPPTSVRQRRRDLAWSAIHAGRLSTARKHARALLREQPRDWASWVLALYACLGPRADALRRLYRHFRWGEK